MTGKISKIEIRIEKFGDGFTITVHKGWHKNVKYVAETIRQLQKVAKDEIDKSFGSAI